MLRRNIICICFALVASNADNESPGSRHDNTGLVQTSLKPNVLESKIRLSIAPPKAADSQSTLHAGRLHHRHDQAFSKAFIASDLTVALLMLAALATVFLVGVYVYSTREKPEPPVDVAAGSTPSSLCTRMAPCRGRVKQTAQLPKDDCHKGTESYPGLTEDVPSMMRWMVGVVVGPGLALIVTVILEVAEPQGLTQEARRLAAVTVWMATWWLVEAVPVGVTGLLPLAVFPPLDIALSTNVASEYATPISWLFFGGMQLAFAMEKSGLHKRCAFLLVRSVGTKPHLLILGFMLAVAFASMFIANTTATLMIFPAARAVVEAIETDASSQSFGKALFLGLAYSASCGGMGSLIGTPVNGVLVKNAAAFNIPLSFGHWMAFAFPLSLVLVTCIWLYLTCVFKIGHAELPADHPALEMIYEDLGPVRDAEKKVAAIFCVSVLSWVTRPYICSTFGLSDGRLEDETISMVMCIVLFITPTQSADGERSQLMDWTALKGKTPWHILLMFGGGFALAQAFSDTALSVWIGSCLRGLGNFPLFLAVLIIVVLMTFLTEVTSNLATASILLPIIGQLACDLHIEPATLMIPATLAASCAFMLPIGTPPNAIVYSTGFFTMKEMAQIGFAMNVGSALLITIWMLTWGQFTFGHLEGTCAK